MKKTFKKLIIISLTLVAILTAGGFLAANYGFFGGGTNAPSVPADTMTRGLVGYWKFEEGTGQTVDNAANTGSVNDGTLGASSAVATDDPKWAKGKNGGGMEFDGVNDYVDCGSDESLNITEAITIEAWVKLAALPSAESMGIVDKMGWVSTFSGYNLEVDTENKYVLRLGNGTENGQRRSLVDAVVGEWTHVVGTYNGNGDIKMYVDGVLSQGWEEAYTGVIGTNSDELGIGENFQDVDRFFNGAIDSVRIYNRALSAEEVRYHYNRGGPVASWGFDEGTGLTAYDSTGNNNDGTLKSSGLDFDGVNDYVSVDDHSSLDITEAITIEAWVKLNELPSVKDETAIILVKLHNSDPWLSYYFAIEKSDKLTFNLRNSAGGSLCWFQSDNAVSKDKWYHFVAIAENGGNAKMYIDNVLQSSQPAITDTIFVSDNGVRIGGWATQYSSDGSIDSVRIYNTALSEAEIARHYKGDFSQDPTDNLVMLHHFEEGMSCDANDVVDCLTDDSSGGLNDGTLKNFDEPASYDNGTDGWILDADWTAGKHNAALEFGGTNGFFQTDSSIAGSNYFSHSLWFKSSDGAYAADEYLFSQGNDDPSVYVDTDGKVNAMADDALKITSASAVADTDWHHLEITADGTDLKLYLDGVMEGTTAYAGSSDTAGVSTAAHISRNNPFSGTIDSVQIYAYARSADEIRLDYNAGVATHLGPSSKTCSEDPAGCMDYGLVGSWNMDEGTGTTAYDGSDEGNDGSLEGGVAWTRNSVLGTQNGVPNGTALQFDGVNDYVDVSVALTNTFTVEMWIYPVNSDSYGGLTVEDNLKGIFYRGTGAYEDENKITYFYVSDNHYSNTQMSANAWHHIVIVNNAGSLTFYLDGASDGTASSAPAMTIEYIGNDNNLEAFNGSIDSVRIYNRALSAEEVRYHYNRGGPVASWGFDEGSGTVIHDSSGNEFHGTLTP